MALLRLTIPLTKPAQLATPLKIACTIIPIGIALRGLLPTPLGSMVMLSAGILASLFSIGLRTLAGALLGCLPNCSDQCSPSIQQPSNPP
ncbi:hypothetical protein D9M71_577360 [compost metagenome]